MHSSTFLVIFVFLGIACHDVNSLPFDPYAYRDDHCTIIHRTSDGLNETYIFDNQIATNSFNRSVRWCHKLGGKMPIIHSDDDMDFLYAVLKNVKLEETGVWIGVKPVANTANCSSQWLDGTDITYNLDFRSCLACERRDCCAVYLSMGSRSSAPKQASLGHCNFSKHRICVIPGQLYVEDSARFLRRTECDAIEVRDEDGNAILRFTSNFTTKVQDYRTTLRPRLQSSYYTSSPSYSRQSVNITNTQDSHHETSNLVFNISGTIAFLALTLAAVFHIKQHITTKKCSKRVYQNVALSVLDS